MKYTKITVNKLRQVLGWFKDFNDGRKYVEYRPTTSTINNKATKCVLNRRDRRLMYSRSCLKHEVVRNYFDRFYMKPKGQRIYKMSPKKTLILSKRY